MTDERIGEALVPTLLSLPPGAGVVFRHYTLPRAERYRLFLRVRRLAQARALRISAAGRLPGAGRHNGRRALTHAAHDRREAIAGIRAGAAWVLVSPLFATRSHADARPLGLRKALTIARGLPASPIALGGMTAARWLNVRHYGFAGWAAIDGLVVRER